MKTFCTHVRAICMYVSLGKGVWLGRGGGLGRCFAGLMSKKATKRTGWRRHGFDLLMYILSGNEFPRERGLHKHGASFAIPP